MNKYIDAEKLIGEIERRKVILDKYKDSFETAACCKQELKWMKDFITSLQQEPAEWCEQDKLHLNNAILAAEKEWGVESFTAKWLKSFRPQPILKPSKEQMEALMYATGEGGTYNKEALKSLMDDLKKQRM